MDLKNQNQIRSTYARAADNYARGGAWRDAGRCYRLAGELRAAAVCYSQIHDHAAAGQCREQLEQWREAGEDYLRASDAANVPR